MTDITAGAARLTAQGFPGTFSGCPFGRPFAYHRLASVGAEIELVDVGRQAAFLDAWDPRGVPMAAIDEDSAGADGR